MYTHAGHQVQEWPAEWGVQLREWPADQESEFQNIIISKKYHQQLIYKYVF